MIANTLNSPYYAVVFTSIRTKDDNGYEKMAEKMLNLVSEQDGFLGVESAREDIGITVSYWKDLESIKKWKENVSHIEAQKKGKEIWYKNYKTRIARVEKEYSF
jgi:heme-degrading monooxygenase HmoA